MPHVSIILPVYNGEATLSRCIDSILHQTFQDFELLIVNDGSQDSSGRLCDAYAARDPRVRVIHKENTGVSHSRSLAMDQAQGTYLQFADADDWLAPDATEQLVSAAATHACGLVISDFYRVIEDRIAQKGSIQEGGLLSRKEYVSHMADDPADFYYGVLWNKLYRRDLVEAHGLRMDETVSWCEDLLFNMDYLVHIDSVYVLRKPLYYYVKTKNSLSSQGARLSKTLQMKGSVFGSYNKFYKEILGDERTWLGAYWFLLASAGDGRVSPAPSVKQRRYANPAKGPGIL